MVAVRIEHGNSLLARLGTTVTNLSKDLNFVMYFQTLNPMHLKPKAGSNLSYILKKLIS